MTLPIAWTIGGSDSGAGAGIQADLKTMNALGVHGCSVITALTAQNTMGVSMIEPVSSAMLEAQLDMLSKDLPARAIKLGMLYSADVMQTVAQHLKNSTAFLICDPVMSATSGNALICNRAIGTLRSVIVPRANLLTPNIPEACRLLGKDPRALDHEQHTVASDEYIEDLAFQLFDLGAKSVLLKGGHRASDYSQDFFTNGHTRAWLTSIKRNTTNTHGTGCTLSAAITAGIATGYELLDAIVIAKAYVNQGLRNAAGLGKGYGPLAHLGWPDQQADLPWITTTASTGRVRTCFPQDRRIGFYPIVDRTQWIEKLLPTGIQIIQLRIKDLSGDQLEEEISQAIELSRQHTLRLYINDYWRLAIKYGAYGVHLGQEDLKMANVYAIQDAGLRLGISTHCYAELASALAYRPSYIAIGPIFPTTAKSMIHKPQGIENLSRWRRSLNYPLVAIGGISLSNAKEVLQTGVDGIAVIRDVIGAPNVVDRASRWMKLFGKDL